MTAGKRWLAPYAATLFAMLALQMSNLGFSPLLPSIREAFHISFAQLGLFAGMYGLLSVVWSVPAGLLAKRFGEKVVLAAGLGMVALGLAALSFAPSFGAAFGARALWLSGYRFAFVCVMVAVALTCPPAVRGASMGILGAISSLASVIGAPLGGIIGRDFGWRNGILVFAAVALAGALVFVTFYRSNPEVLDPRPAHGGAVSSSAFRSPLLWALALLSGLAGMGSLSANFFVPSAAQALFHLDQVGASYLISTGFTLAIFVNLLFGFLMDRFNRWKVMAALAGLGVLGGVAMTSHDLLVFRIGTALVLALGHAGIQQSYTLAADVLRGRETGNVMGVVSMVAGVFSYLGPQMLGLLRDWSGGFVAGWYLIVGAAGATLLLVIALWSYSSRQVRMTVGAATVLLLTLAFPASPQAQPRWIEPGQGAALPAELHFDDSIGRLEVVNASGPVDTMGHAFFEPLGGERPRLCHVPSACLRHDYFGRRGSRAMECDSWQGSAVNFVACPVVRDTKTVPCFLADYQGETYFLGIQQDIIPEFYPPQLLHQALAEGVVVPGPRVCGGIPLKPLHVSVIPEVNRGCNTILPAEPGINAPPSKRPAGPSTRKAPVSTAEAPPRKPEPSFPEREFVIEYDFDSDFLFARNTRQLTDIAEYARVSKAQTVEVVGYRGSTLLSNGSLLIEKADVSRLRAERVAEVLKGLGTPASTVRWIEEPAAANGATDYESRRVAVRVLPISQENKP